MSFGKNLGADQNIDFPRMDPSAHCLPCMFTARTVAVNALDAGSRKSARQRVFDTLRTLSQRQGGTCMYDQWKWVDSYGRTHGTIAGFTAFIPGKPDKFLTV